ncbi:MAG TPA: hypothetical protein VNJ08_00750 [Bacteriovoracaceae bacterium]|nr:hypothetical protein [Bacteriovoracaceae bacterium]
MKSLLTVLCFILISPAFAEPCGLQGSVDERIKSCAKVKDNFILVTSTSDGREIYKDSKSGLIWSSRISVEMNHYGSQKACPSELLESKILDLKWRLPTLREFEQAADHGIKTALPNMNHSFWTSTPVQGKSKKRRKRNAPPAGVFMWDGMDEVTSTGSLIDAGSVRCVSFY